MALLQFAVFMNAGSYVMSPTSSADVLICRRSMARIVPFWIGRSYFLPVRLSVTVSVSAIVRSTFAFVLFRFVRFRYRVARNPVSAGGPAGQILQLAPLAAERPIRLVNRMPPAQHAQRGHTHK